MITVSFVDVGRGKKSWSAMTKLVNENFLFRSIKKNKALLSDDIDFSFDGQQGEIFVGGRPVGKFTVKDTVSNA